MKPINIEKLILASNSPRRKKLLEQIGIKIKISPSIINEESVQIKTPEAYVQELSFLKSEDTALLYPESWILGANRFLLNRFQAPIPMLSDCLFVRLLKHL